MSNENSYPFDFRFVSPKEAAELGLDNGNKNIAHYRHLVRNNKTCTSCYVNVVWKLADCGMCFSCTTGTLDASEDYELE